MKRPAMKKKLWVVGVLSVLPVLAIGALLFYRIDREMAAERRQQQAIRYIGQTVALAERIYQQGRLFHALSERDPNARSVLAEEQVRTEQAIVEIEKLHRMLPLAPETIKRWNFVFSLIQDLKNRSQTMSVDEIDRFVFLVERHLFLLGNETAMTIGVGAERFFERSRQLGFVLEDVPVLLEYFRQFASGMPVSAESVVLSLETAKSRFPLENRTAAFYFAEIERFADAVRRPSEPGARAALTDAAAKAVFRLSANVLAELESDLARSLERLAVYRTGIAVATTAAIALEIWVFGKFYRSVSASVAALQHAERQAYFDPLTELPNRQMISRIWQEKKRTSESRGHSTAILFLDLDRFKNINDTFGHRAGDELVKATADRMKACLRDGDHVCRIGGDEFLLIVADVAGESDARTFAERLLGEISRPFAVGEHELVVSASIGISLYPRDGEELDLLIHRADAAMYQAKRRGRNGYCFFRPEMNEEARKRLWTELNLRKGMERGEFVLYYQPRIELSEGTLTGMEALLRWKTVERGIVTPMEFLDVAEETGFIVPLGEWILRTACRQVEQWRAEYGTDIPVSVNISSIQFQRDDFVGTVEAVLRETSIAPHCLELELRESAMMPDADAAAAKLRRLKDLGVRIAIDDFGTGFSSLQDLKRFPIDRLKIDRSFIKDVPHGPKDTAITKTIIALGRRLNLRTVAEGVETDDQLSFLQVRKCNEAQGNFICPPLAPESVANWLRQGSTLRAT